MAGNGGIFIGQNLIILINCCFSRRIPLNFLPVYRGRKQDFLLSHKIKFGSGTEVVFPYIYFSAKTGKGEKGTAAFIVTADASGSASNSAGFACDVKGVGVPVEFDYLTVAAAG